MRHELLFPERCALLYEDAVKVKWIYVANALTYQAMHSTCKWESAGKMDRRALKVITVHLATGSSVVNKHWEETEGLVLASRKGSHLNLIKRYCKKNSSLLQMHCIIGSSWTCSRIYSLEKNLWTRFSVLWTIFLAFLSVVIIVHRVWGPNVTLNNNLRTCWIK